MAIKTQHVPYKGSGPAFTDLVAGRIQAMLVTLPPVIGFIDSSSMRPPERRQPP